MQNSFILLILLILASCATDIDFNVPGNRFDTPETTGDTLKGEVGFGVGDSVEVTTVNVIADVIFNRFDSVNTNTTLRKNSALQLNANVGIIDRFDFTYKNYTDAPSYYGIKVQLYGASQQKSEKGLKVSTGAALAYMKDDEGNLVVGDPNGSERREYHGQLKITGSEYSFNIGYRTGADFLIYLNNYYGKLKSVSSLTSNVYPNTTITGNVVTQGHLLGFSLGRKVSLRLEAGVSKLRWEKMMEIKTYPVGLYVSYNW